MFHRERLMNGSERAALSVVVPTLNEAKNLRHAVRRIDRALRGIPHEVIVVDDASIDGTAEIADELAAAPGSTVRVIHRPRSSRGLSAAILEGFSAAHGDALAVLDADLQHDPAVLPGLLAALDRADVAVGSRYGCEGRTCGWSVFREIESRAAAALTRAVLDLRTRDPLSGCFAMRRAGFDAVCHGLRPRGWKLLLDILAAGRDLCVAEVPMRFRARVRGKTKMNAAVVMAWLRQLRELRRDGRRAPLLSPIGAHP